MGKHNKAIINVICSLLVLATNITIGFWMSPFIVEHIGVEANGFVSLANNFFVYACIVTMALNSMAARFITIEYVRKNYNQANLYYNSVFWGNLLIVALLLLPAVYCIVRLETFINIPCDILLDVKLLFFFIFFNFFINTGFPNWECGTYITNRLDRDYIPNMFTTIFRYIIIISMMILLTPKVWYVGFAASIAAILLLVVRRYNTHKLTPHLKIYFSKQDRLFSWDAVKELVGAGMWNSISTVGHILLTSLDLLICNYYLGATAMGVVALSKFIPSCIEQLSLSVRNAFGAELTINYANGDTNTLFRDLSRAMKMTALIMLTPIACVVIFGEPFFALWVPTQDARLLQILSFLAIFAYMFTSGTQILYNVFSTVNRVKTNSIVVVVSGIFSILLTITLIKYTNIGIYAVAGISTIVTLLRNMLFTLPMTAIYLGFNWKQFYPQVIRTILVSVILIIIGFCVKPYVKTDTWSDLFISVILYSIISMIVSLFFLLNKSERLMLFHRIVTSNN